MQFRNFPFVKSFVYFVIFVMLSLILMTFIEAFNVDKVNKFVTMFAPFAIAYVAYQQYLLALRQHDLTREQMQILQSQADIARSNRDIAQINSDISRENKEISTKKVRLDLFGRRYEAYGEIKKAVEKISFYQDFINKVDREMEDLTRSIRFGQDLHEDDPKKQIYTENDFNKVKKDIEDIIIEYKISFRQIEYLFGEDAFVSCRNIEHNMEEFINNLRYEKTSFRITFGYVPGCMEAYNQIIRELSKLEHQIYPYMNIQDVI